MGFYGQVVYEFTKLFSKFLITKSSSTEIPVTPPDENQPIFLEADNMWEQIDIKPMNRWIQLNGSGENSTTKCIEIGHSSAGQSVDNKQTISVEKWYDEVDETEQLYGGDCLKIATTNYDAAGHLVDNNPTYHYYNLPQITVHVGEQQENGTNDNFYIKGDANWISATVQENADEGRNEIVFSHILPQAGDENVTTEDINTFSAIESYEGEPIQLSYGDLITTSKLTKDDKGHVLKHETVCYQLPISQSEEDFEELEEDVKGLENRLESGTLDNVMGASVSYGPYEDVVRRLYEIGNIDNLYGNGLANQTLIEAIGQLDGNNGYSKHIASLSSLANTEDACYTISEALTQLCNAIQKDRDDIALIKQVLNSRGEE